MNYADTNWLEAVYITPHPDDAEGQERERMVERCRFRRASHGTPKLKDSNRGSLWKQLARANRN